MKITTSSNHLICLLLSAFCLLPSAIFAQDVEYEYHPYEYAQEELFLTSNTVRERRESNDCASAAEIINKFNRKNRTEEERLNDMRTISFFSCPEAYVFLQEQIKTNPSETERCYAIIFLSWMMKPEQIPFIVEYAQKSRLSIQERVALATAYAVFGINFSYFGLREQAKQILNDICFDASDDILWACILSYFNLGGNEAIQFFTSQLEKEEYKLYAALWLARLGEYETTYPIFVEALDDNDHNNIHLAINGLATISTEETMQIILSIDSNKQMRLPKRARWNYDLIFKKGDKL